MAAAWALRFRLEVRVSVGLRVVVVEVGLVVVFESGSRGGVELVVEDDAVAVPCLEVRAACARGPRGMR